MNAYQKISTRDIVSKLKPEFDKGACYLRDDGKITRSTRISHQTPWIHWKQAPNRNCNWYHVFFNYFGFIHSRCQECWKVVVRPRTLVELEALMQLQKVLDLPSKCGIERRETVCGLYGGYFYNDSKEEGLQCYKTIRGAIDKSIGVDVPVILKRGCTEFEITLDGKNPSDQWEVSGDQKALEYRLDDVIDMDVTKNPQPEHLKESIFRTWIHWAYANGDMTYQQYTDGESLFPAYVTYHQEAENDKKEKHRVASSKRQNKRKAAHKKTKE